MRSSQWISGFAALLFVSAAACSASPDADTDDESGDESDIVKARADEAGTPCGPLNPVHRKCGEGFECALKGDSGVCVKSESEEGRACGPLNAVHRNCATGFECALVGDSGV